MPFSPADFTFCMLQTGLLICKSLLFRWHKCEAFFLFFGNHFHVKYNTLYFIFIKCVLCEAVGSADQNHKTFKTFLFFTRKKKQKNLTSATSAKGDLLSFLV